jgi:hypothetical protein
MIYDRGDDNACALFSSWSIAIGEAELLVLFVFAATRNRLAGLFFSIIFLLFFDWMHS